MKKKIALVVQRYGLEVNGGAELHCRLLAERLNACYDVVVLTSCAQDYKTWNNYYDEGETDVNGVRVIRFKTLHSRNPKELHKLHRKFRKRKPHQKVLRSLGILEYLEQKFPVLDLITEQDEYDWAKNQGPYLPNLIRYLKEHEEQYSALIFFTYLYFPTIYGLRVNPAKSILIPTAHDEPPIYFPIFKKVFLLPKMILFNTDMERQFVQNLFENHFIKNDIVGVGFEKTLSSSTNVRAVKHEYGLSENVKYFIYIGRIDEAKGCKELCDYFLEFCKNNDHLNVKLVLVGQDLMQLQPNEYIVKTGFVDDDIKNTLMVEAVALIIPSYFESLSMVTLESMINGVPVIANRHSEVLKSHILQSEGGFLYDSYTSFERVLKDALNKSADDLALMGSKAKEYVERNYSWDVIMKKLKTAVSYIVNQ
ncbi:glycosyltransferase family 4 protein [Olivibacter sp. XZL3]|uniref:glycosyltransferase family 4 protein n=1 Tax=Olivibacter sp. XZL3 TaxID=1735116 RepID=UPI0014170B9F|nr:glycosyltransferase family 4 protein [Olivibacter sp. XZL3]